jgi:hypothetical protein
VVDRFEYDLVRRDLALDLLDDLLDDWNPQPIASIATLDIGQVEESELERRFKVAIRAWAEHPANDEVTFRAIPGKGGHDAFELIFTVGGDTIRYRIDEQEGLGTSPSTIPDFVIHRQDAQAPDVAIYLDGYQFHASATINNLADDASKREGVRAAQKLVWNLTWRDVDDFHRATLGEDLRQPPTRPLLSTAAQGVAATIHHRRDGTIDYPTINRNPVSLLLTYLSQPDLLQWERLALSAVGGLASEAKLDHPINADQIQGVVTAAVAGQLDWPAPAGDAVAVAGQWVTVNGLLVTALLSTADANAERWTVVSSIPSRAVDVEAAQHRERWADWMQWANVLQFLRGYGRNAVIAATTQADMIDLDHLWLLDGGRAAPAAEPAVAPSAEPELRELSPEQEEELELIDDDAVRRLARSALERGAPDLIAGFEVDGHPVEVMWPDQRVGIALDGDDRGVDGYEVRPVSEWPLDELLARLQGAR